MKTKNILILSNIAVYILLSFQPQWFDALSNSYPTTIQQHQYWRLITYAWAHGNIWHLFFNMYFLNVVAKLDSRNLLLKYLFCLQMAGIFSITSNTQIISIGASGAVLGILANIIVGTLIDKPYKLKEPSVWLVIAFVVVVSVLPLPNTDVMAHVGGIIGGILLLLIKDKLVQNSNRQLLFLVFILCYTL